MTQTEFQQIIEDLKCDSRELVKSVNGLGKSIVKIETKMDNLVTTTDLLMTMQGHLESNHKKVSTAPPPAANQAKEVGKYLGMGGSMGAAFYLMYELVMIIKGLI